MTEGVFLEQATELIRKHVQKITDTEMVEVKEAGGRILAEDIYASVDNPPFPRSPVDGYAARAEDLQGASGDTPVKLTVTGCIYAGDDGQSMTVKQGECCRIMTGGPFPKGADTAIKQEDTDYGEETVEIYREQQAFDNYCFQGEDYKKGTLLITEGVRLTFAEQGILAGIGRTHVKVYRNPVIRVFATGDELCRPGLPLKPGKIYDSNSMMVSARLHELGIMPASVAHSDDSEEGVAQDLKKASEDADIIVTTGGVSVGKKDILHGALELLGAEKIFWRVKIQPGTPTIFSVYKNTLILSLSGNPFGAMANLELLLRPMLREMTGNEIFHIEQNDGIACMEFPKKSRMRRFVRAVYRNGEVSLPQGIFSSGAIGTLRGCNCFLDIPAGTGCIKKGEKVHVWML